MQEFHTGTLYVFIEEQTNSLIFRTSDIRELNKAIPSEVIVIGSIVRYEDVEYKVAGFEIIISQQPMKLNRYSNQVGENNPYGINAVFYVTKS